MITNLQIFSCQNNMSIYIYISFINYIFLFEGYLPVLKTHIEIIFDYMIYIYILFYMYLYQ